jgi:hypothetical protein
MFLEATHLDLNFCFDVGPRQHARQYRKRVQIDEGAHPLDAHPRQQRNRRHPPFPTLAEGGTIDWARTMDLLRSHGEQYPLMLELRGVPEFPQPIESAIKVFENLEKATAEHHES